MNFTFSSCAHGTYSRIDNILDHKSSLPWKIQKKKKKKKKKKEKMKSFQAYFLITMKSFPGGSKVKASACKAGDPGSIPGSGRSPGEGNGNPLSILAWRIPWMEETGRLQSMGLQRVRHD